MQKQSLEVVLQKGENLLVSYRRAPMLSVVSCCPVNSLYILRRKLQFWEYFLISKVCVRMAEKNNTTKDNPIRKKEAMKQLSRFEPIKNLSVKQIKIK